MTVLHLPLRRPPPTETACCAVILPSQGRALCIPERVWLALSRPAFLSGGRALTALQGTCETIEALGWGFSLRAVCPVSPHAAAANLWKYKSAPSDIESLRGPRGPRAPRSEP